MKNYTYQTVYQDTITCRDVILKRPSFPLDSKSQRQKGSQVFLQNVKTLRELLDQNINNGKI